MKKITVEVKPYSTKSDITFKKNLFNKTIYVVNVKAPSEKGQANKALIKCLAQHFNVDKKDIEIKTGITSRLKTILINTT